MLYIVIAALAIALTLYTLFGGADYGAGILSLCPWGKNKEAVRGLISKTISPVWEANHVWLILIVVILFVGFPAVYSAVSRHLHWPVVAVLVGIICRGCAFTFMHYDPIKDQTQEWYQKFFAAASLWTSFWLGVVLGGMSSGEIHLEGSTYNVFFAGWLNPYSILLGLFSASIFTFLASVYLLGETEEYSIRIAIRRKSFGFLISMVGLGAAVFTASIFNEHQMVYRFSESLGSLVLFSVASILLIPLIKSIIQFKAIQARIYAASVVTCVVFGWMLSNFPIAINIKGGSIDFYTAAVSSETLSQLFIALVVGLVLIIPSLVFLFKLSQK